MSVERRPAGKVLFLVPYPLQAAPSQRFRVELFLSELTKASFHYSIKPFIDLRTWQRLYKKGHFMFKTWGLFKGFVGRWWIIFFKLPFFDFIFIHREAAPIGPPVFEWVIAKLYRKKIIYDFDDAIWISNTSSANYFINWSKASWKVKYLCKWAYKIVAGNDYLRNFAIQFNQNVVKIPTCVDTEIIRFALKENDNGRPSIGWTGSHSTLKYLREIVPVIDELGKEIDFDFIVIADKNPAPSLKNFRFIPWKASTEWEDLSKIHIGIMPLIPDAWSEGKCGFKLIQYFSCGIPAVASPVGVNKVIVEDGVNGFLCYTHDQWVSAFKKLLSDECLRKQMGIAGREKIEAHYSLQSQVSKFIELFS